MIIEQVVERGERQIKDWTYGEPQLGCRRGNSAGAVAEEDRVVAEGVLARQRGRLLVLLEVRLLLLRVEVSPRPQELPRASLQAGVFPLALRMAPRGAGQLWRHGRCDPGTF